MARADAGPPARDAGSNWMKGILLMDRRTLIEERIREAPGDVFLHYTYAMELTKLGESAAAQAAFAEARRLDPDYVPAYFQAGQQCAATGATSEAIALLQQGIVIARRLGDGHAVGEMQDLLDSLEH